MNIVIVSIDEPVYLYQFWKRILEDLHPQVSRICIFRPPARNWRRFLYDNLYNFLLVLYLYQPKDILRVINDYSLAMLTRRKASFSLSNLANYYKIPVFYTDSVNSKAFIEGLGSAYPDLILAQVPARIGKDALGVPRLGWLNKHFGLLPDYRGAAPFLWAYWNREPALGVTIHFMNEDYDEGDILGQARELLKYNDTLSSALKRLNKTAANLMVDCIKNTPQRQTQENRIGRYFSKPGMRQLLTNILCEYKHRAYLSGCGARNGS